jgi:hypothetical protein
MNEHARSAGRFRLRLPIVLLLDVSIYQRLTSGRRFFPREA